MFRVVDPTSFSNLRLWLDEINRYAFGYTQNKIIVGNCCDILDRQVSFEEAKALADSFDAPYIEVSAKSGYNVSKLFLIATALAMKSSEKFNFLVSPDENRASSAAQTVHSSFKKPKYLKIQIEGCIVKLVDEEVSISLSMLKCLKRGYAYEEIPCSSISDCKYSNNNYSELLSFSVGTKKYKFTVYFQTSKKDNFLSIQQAVCRGQFIEKWKKR